MAEGDIYRENIMQREDSIVLQGYSIQSAPVHHLIFHSLTKKFAAQSCIWGKKRLQMQ